jgi:hypothetical protein
MAAGSDSEGFKTSDDDYDDGIRVDIDLSAALREEDEEEEHSSEIEEKRGNDQGKEKAPAKITKEEKKKTTTADDVNSEPMILDNESDQDEDDAEEEVEPRGKRARAKGKKVTSGDLDEEEEEEEEEIPRGKKKTPSVENAAGEKDSTEARSASKDKPEEETSRKRKPGSKSKPIKVIWGPIIGGPRPVKKKEDKEQDGKQKKGKAEPSKKRKGATTKQGQGQQQQSAKEPQMTEYKSAELLYPPMSTEAERSLKICKGGFTRVIWRSEATDDPLDGGIYKFCNLVNDGVAKAKKFRVRRFAPLRQVTGVPEWLDVKTEAGEDVLVGTDTVLFVTKDCFPALYDVCVAMDKQALAPGADLDASSMLPAGSAAAATSSSQGEASASSSGKGAESQGDRYYLMQGQYATEQISEDGKTKTYAYVDQTKLPAGVTPAGFLVDKNLTAYPSSALYRDETGYKSTKADKTNNVLMPPEGFYCGDKERAAEKKLKPKKKKQKKETKAAPAPAQAKEAAAAAKGSGSKKQEDEHHHHHHHRHREEEDAKEEESKAAHAAEEKENPQKPKKKEKAAANEKAKVKKGKKQEDAVAEEAVDEKMAAAPKSKLCAIDPTELAKAMLNGGRLSETQKRSILLSAVVALFSDGT